MLGERTIEVFRQAKPVGVLGSDGIHAVARRHRQNAIQGEIQPLPQLQAVAMKTVSSVQLTSGARRHEGLVIPSTLLEMASKVASWIRRTSFLTLPSLMRFPLANQSDGEPRIRRSVSRIPMAQAQHTT